LGKRTNIASDQFHLIIDWWVTDHQQDNQLLIPTLDRIKKHYPVSDCNSDKGYYSKIDVDLIELFNIKAYISKKGKCNVIQMQKESDPTFIEARHSHSAVESNINELEHRGLNRCADKSIKGMHRYVGLAVIAYNLRRIGDILLKTEPKRVRFRRAA